MPKTIYESIIKVTGKCLIERSALTLPRLKPSLPPRAEAWPEIDRVGTELTKRFTFVNVVSILKRVTLKTEK